MLCQRCGEKYVFWVLVSRAPANTHTEATCPDCLDPEVDELWANISSYPGRELALENKTRHRYITQDLGRHVAGLQELGALSKDSEHALEHSPQGV